MTLKLAASVTVAQTVAGIVFSFLSIKITSVYLGPSGLGALGQLGYFMALMQAILAAGVGTGLTKRTAELGSDTQGRALAISTVLRSLISLGIPVALLIAATSFWIARDFLNDARIQAPLVAFSLSLVFGLVSNTIMSGAYGAKDFRSIAIINISTGAASLVMTLLLAPKFGLSGVLFGTALIPIVTFAVGWWASKSTTWWPRKPLSHGFSVPELRGVTSFIPLAIISSVGAPLLQLLFRDEVVAHSGMNAVGLLQGVMRISDMYVGLAGGILSMYFFPRFCEIRTSREFVREIGRAVVLVGSAGIVIGIVIYIFRNLIVHAIFTKEFLPMTELFGWQIVGNTLRLAAWPLSFALLSKANSIIYAAFELGLMISLWAVSTYFVSRNGAIGVPETYVFTYVIYISVALFGLSRVIKKLDVTG